MGRAVDRTIVRRVETRTSRPLAGTCDKAKTYRFWRWRVAEDALPDKYGRGHGISKGFRLKPAEQEELKRGESSPGWSSHHVEKGRRKRATSWLESARVVSAGVDEAVLGQRGVVGHLAAKKGVGSKLDISSARLQKRGNEHALPGGYVEVRVTFIRITIDIGCKGAEGQS